MITHPFESQANRVMEKVLHRIPTRVRHDGVHYFVDDEIIDCFGIGTTLAEAQVNYLLAVQDLYDDLSANEDRLASYVLAQLDYLRKITR